MSFLYLPVYSTFSKLAFHSEHSRPVLLDLIYIYLWTNCQNKYDVRQCLNEVCIFALYCILLSLEYSTCWINHWESVVTIFPICFCINTWHSHHSCMCVCACTFLHCSLVYFFICLHACWSLRWEKTGRDLGPERWSIIIVIRPQSRDRLRTVSLYYYPEACH